jgi:hypothetical protein
MTIVPQDFPDRLDHASGRELLRDKSRVLLSFEPTDGTVEIQDFLNIFKLVVEDYQSLGERILRTVKRLLLRKPWDQDPRLNKSKFRLWIRSRNGKNIEQSVIEQLAEQSGKSLKPLRWIAPVYRFPKTKGRNGLLAILPNILLIKKQEEVEPDEVLDTALEKYMLAPRKKLSKYLAGYRYYVLRSGGNHSLFELHQNLPKWEKHLVKTSHLDYTPLLSPSGQGGGFIPNDAFYQSQWNLVQIHAQEGWNFLDPANPTLGKGTIVAILDQEGCDLKHPDLNGAFDDPRGSGTLGATFEGDGDSDTVDEDASVKEPGGEITADTSDDHGTRCAGIVAARYNSEGIAGLAGECTIMSLKFTHWDLSEFVAAVRYAADHDPKADVISMSYGDDGSMEGFLNHPLLNAAIDHAHGKKVVLCVAAMNKNATSLEYPAAHPKVIACGASGRNDKRAGFSNHGFHRDKTTGKITGYLSVVAPGEDIPTTINNNNPSRAEPYISAWWGTSAATPHVAGLAALLINGFPPLKDNPDGVRNVIEASAKSVHPGTTGGEYVYHQENGEIPNGDWNEEMGHGRIDVLAAFQFAKQNYSGPA